MNCLCPDVEPQACSLCQDRRCEPVPGCLACIGVMEHTGRVTVKQCPYGDSDIRCPGRRTDLIADHAQWLATPGNSQHCLYKVLTVNPVNPCGAQYDCIRHGFKHSPLAFKLALTIDAQRIRQIILSIGVRLPAIKHEIR